jgi:hypothetical protein
VKRTIRRRMCTSKVRYRDERAAEREMKLLAQAGFRMKTYRCKRCGAVHLATVREAAA